MAKPVKQSQAVDLTCIETPTNIDKLLMQDFMTKLNADPDPKMLVETADGKAKTLGISFVEMLLDELYFGQWSTENFQHTTQANELCGRIELVVIHPVTGAMIRRTGSASIQVMVNKGSDPLDIRNKKANALDMGFPKLKAECIKNAAQSLGRVFGRDLNRKQSKGYNPVVKQLNEAVLNQVITMIEDGKAERSEAIRRMQTAYSMTEEQLSRLSSANLKQLAAHE